MQSPTVNDIMIKEVVAVSPETSLVEAARLLAEHKFDGVPVLDKEEKLVGILTEYDLISKGAAIHLPTLQTVLGNLKVFQHDRSKFQKEIKEVTTLLVRDVMNEDPLTLPDGASFEEALLAFRDHHRVNPIPVVDKERRVVGVVSRFDILKPLQQLAEGKQ